MRVSNAMSVNIKTQSPITSIYLHKCGFSWTSHANAQNDGRLLLLFVLGWHVVVLKANFFFVCHLYRLLTQRAQDKNVTLWSHRWMHTATKVWPNSRGAVHISIEAICLHTMKPNINTVKWCNLDALLLSFSFHQLQHRIPMAFKVSKACASASTLQILTLMHNGSMNWNNGRKHAMLLTRMTMMEP